MEIKSIDAVYSISGEEGARRIELTVDFGDGDEAIVYLYRPNDPHKNSEIETALQSWSGSITDWTPDLSETKTGLCAQVDAAAETERLKYITYGSGQALEYQNVALEAQAYLAALAQNPSYDPEAGTYPMLEATIGVDGDTLEEVATVVVGMELQWRGIGSAIRAVRLTAKSAIQSAESVSEAMGIFQSIEWPAP